MSNNGTPILLTASTTPFTFLFHDSDSYPKPKTFPIDLNHKKLISSVNAIFQGIAKVTCGS